MWQDLPQKIGGPADNFDMCQPMCQPLFTVFGRHILQEIFKKGITALHGLRDCITLQIPCKILITTLDMFTAILMRRKCKNKYERYYGMECVQQL